MGDFDLPASAVLKIIEAGTLATFQLLVIAALCGFIKYLLLELRDSRKEFTGATMKFIETVVSLKEIVRHALHSKD